MLCLCMPHTPEGLEEPRYPPAALLFSMSLQTTKPKKQLAPN